jgi:hypothetical protein
VHGDLRCEKLGEPFLLIVTEGVQTVNGAQRVSVVAASAAGWMNYYGRFYRAKSLGLYQVKKRVHHAPASSGEPKRPGKSCRYFRVL